MPRFIHCLILSFIFICQTVYLSAQTTLMPGDLMVVAFSTDMGACGLPAQSDHVSFMCFKDILPGTVIDFTDNGWEHTNPGFWGDSEGTYRMTRTGGIILKGTVITIEGRNEVGGWMYRTISPDNGWTFTNINVPGGP